MIKSSDTINYISQWLIGILEDDPLPPEIQYMTFYVHFNNDYIFLSVTFNELNEERYDFCPLETELFFYKPFFHNNKLELNQPMVKYLIEESCKVDILQSYIENIKIKIVFSSC